MSEPSPPPLALGPGWVLRQVRKLLHRTWGVFRESRLGLIGLSIVIMFALIALLAPWIAPYSKTFTAPDSDKFTVYSYVQPLDPGTYNAPVMGPTTPLSDRGDGGEWLINSAREGFISMNFAQYVLGTNVTPFQKGNVSYHFDVTQDFDVGLDARPTAPLLATYFMVPGRNVTCSGGTSGGVVGGTTRNGAIAFFAGREFVAAIPWNKSTFYHYPLPFKPNWTGEDPAAGGNMLAIPTQRKANIGLNTFPVGPYRYFYASDGNQTIVFQVSYVHEGDEGCPLFGGRYQVVVPNGTVVLAFNGNLSAPPFLYYDQSYVTSYDQWRSGAGQAIILPLQNNTMAVYNVSGKFRAWVPITLDGQPAKIVGEIGYIRSQYPTELYLPLRSATAAGLATFDTSSLTFVRTLVFPHPDWRPIGSPTSYRATATYVGFYNETGNSSLLIATNATGAFIPQFNVTFPGLIQNYFEVYERNQVFVYLDDGKLYSLNTTYASGGTVPALLFSLFPKSGSAKLVYAGTIAGTLYGSGLSPEEMFGVWTQSTPAESRLFQFLGTIHTPLPPGLYPSGNRYLLGTDYYGEDILTQLIWGTQVAFIVGILAALFTVVIGTLVGLIAGYYGKIVDTLLMRTTDIFLVLPFLPIVLVLTSILRPSVWIIILVLSIVGWPGIARVIRAQVLTLKERPFIDAARVSGASDSRLIFRHIMPNVLPFTFLYMSLTVSGAIITEAALSFLGLGDPTSHSWGQLLSTVLTFGGALTAWWWLIPPGIAITLLSLGFYLVGRGFDEIINPRLRRR